MCSDTIYHHSGSPVCLPEPYNTMLENRRLRVFGDELKKLLASRNATEQVLLDVDPVRRLEALHLVFDYWRPSPSSEELYKRMALNDPDPEVRVEALQCWSRLYRGSEDVVFSKALAAIIYDESMTSKFRAAAYLGLCAVQSISVPSKLEFLKSYVYDNENLPDVLDWEIVKKFV